MAKLHDIEVDDYLADSVRLMPEAINTEFERVATDLAYWGARYAEAFRTERIAKIELERTEARLFIKHREEMIQAGVKATEAAINANVMTDQELFDARMQYVEAEVEVKRMSGACEAVRAKREMLVSLGAQIRAEMAGDPLIRQRHAESRQYNGG